MSQCLRWFLLACSMVLLGGGGSAIAHEMSMAEMQVREMAPGEFIWQWSAAEKGAPSEVLTPIWPEGCTAESNVLHCGAQGMTGTMRMEGVGKAYSAALIKVYWFDGQYKVYTLTAGQPAVNFYGGADDNRGMSEVAYAYLLLGIEHILEGIDHLCFVIALLFLVGFNRKLLWTITAFTAAHSLTLASSALGLLTLRPPPVEACIALSIVLVIVEALNTNQQTMARRWPALVAFLFGLVHGLGFAGALKEIGLPEHNMLVALLTFNVGVEIGQLMTVAVAWLIWRLVASMPKIALARTVALYGIGTMASYWACSRIVAIFA